MIRSFVREKRGEIVFPLTQFYKILQYKGNDLCEFDILCCQSDMRVRNDVLHCTLGLIRELGFLFE